MSKGTLILVVWLIIGAAAAGQRGYYDAAKPGCTDGATIAVTIAAGPLNYVGLDPKIHPQTQRLSSRFVRTAHQGRSVKISSAERPWFIALRPGASPPRAGAGGSAESCR